MTINEVGELSTTLLIILGMFVMGVYLVYVMFGTFNMSRKKEAHTNAHPTTLSTTPHYHTNHGACAYACNRSIHYRD